MSCLPFRWPIDGPSAVAFADAVLDGEESVEEKAESEKLRPKERGGKEPLHPAIGPSRKLRMRRKIKYYSSLGAE